MRDRIGQVSDDHRLAADDVRAAVLELPLRHGRRFADQGDRPGALRFGEPRLHPYGDKRRVGAREEVGEPLLGCTCRLRRVEHERRDEVRFVDARASRQPVLQRQRDQFLLEARERDAARPLSEHERLSVPESPGQGGGLHDPLRLRRLCLRCDGPRGELLVDLFGRLVDERAGPEHDLDGVRLRQLAAGPGEPPLGREPARRNIAGEAPLEAEETVDVRAQDELLQVALDEHGDRLFAEAAVVALRRLVFGARARDEGARGSRRVQPHGEEHPREADHRGEREHEPRAPCTRPRDRGQGPRGAHSIPRGPADSPERNWRTNGFSDANSSDAGPDSTIRPFHRTEMCSATRRALMMSCVITT